MTSPIPLNHRIAEIIVPIAFIVIGGWFVAHIADGQKAERIRLETFSPVEATIVSRRVEWWSAGEEGGTYPVPILVYDYDVNGSRFQSEVVNVSGAYPVESFEEALAFLDQHPVESSITCYINPNDPSDAFLIRVPREAVDYMIGKGAAGFFFVLGVLLVIRAAFRHLRGGK